MKDFRKNISKANRAIEMAMIEINKLRSSNLTLRNI